MSVLCLPLDKALNFRDRKSSNINLSTCFQFFLLVMLLGRALHGPIFRNSLHFKLLTLIFFSHSYI